MSELRIIPLQIEKDFRPGEALASEILSSLRKKKLSISHGDILVVKHKIVSKAEGQIVDLASVKPSRSSQAWARQHRLDPRVVELALNQSRRVVRRKRGVLITETRRGLVCANSGVDVSNVDGGRHALLLPEDPDRSAASLHRELKKRLNLSIPIIITDTFGRPWREGLVEVAIGVAGMKPLRDHRGTRDPYGYKLRASLDAVADLLACAAGLVCDKLNRVPACIIRGFGYEPGRGTARDLIRPAKNDLFR